MSYAYEYDVKYNICHLRKKEQNEVKIFGCVFSLVIIQGKLIRRVMTPISRTYIFDKSTDDFFMKFYRTRETDGSAGQTFDSGSQGQIVTLNVLSKKSYQSDASPSVTL